MGRGEKGAGAGFNARAGDPYPDSAFLYDHTAALNDDRAADQTDPARDTEYHGGC